jgi:hypothetical protein
MPVIDSSGSSIFIIEKHRVLLLELYQQNEWLAGLAIQYFGFSQKFRTKRVAGR